MVISDGDTAYTGSFGRKLETMRAVRPVAVGAMMQMAPQRSAVVTEAKPMAPLTLRTPPRSK